MPDQDDRAYREHRYCPACALVRPVEIPPCADGHGADCPERVCLACGDALLVGATDTGTGQDVTLAHGRAA